MPASRTCSIIRLSSPRRFHDLRNGQLRRCKAMYF